MNTYKSTCFIHYYGRRKKPFLPPIGHWTENFSSLQAAQQIQLALRIDSRLQAGKSQQAGDRLFSFDPRVLAEAEMVNEAQAAQAIEPAVKGADEGFSLPVLAAQPVPDVRKIMARQKACKMSREGVCLSKQDISPLFPILGRQSQPAPRMAKTAGGWNRTACLSPASNRETARPVPKGTRPEGREEGKTVVPVSGATPVVLASCCRK